MKVEIVNGPLSLGKPSRARYRTAHVDGRTVRIRMLDADSPTFGADFHASFKANVRRARAENQALKIEP